MYIRAETLDDLMHAVFTELLKLPFDINSSRSKENGKSSEIFGVLLQLDNPRARLSRTETKGTPFSALGELLWYLSKGKDLDFISYYISAYIKESSDGKTIYGAYGPRLFNMRNKYDQINHIIDLLKKKTTTRRAIIQLIDVTDLISAEKEIPCTCTLQFVIRSGELNMLTSIRSNDAYLGLPHDIFCFTMLQEIIARSVNVDIGQYKHVVGSLHLYESKKRAAQQYLNEGYQSTKISMPEMPIENPWPSIERLLTAEASIRTGNSINVLELGLAPYWLDLAHLLEIHAQFKKPNLAVIKGIQQKMTNSIYNTYIQKRIDNAK